MTASNLQSLGLDIVQAASAPEALANTLRCHLALVELVLPYGSSGLELAAQLRSAGVSAVIHTSGATLEAREAAAAIGIPLLPKSTDLKMVAAVLLQAWHRVAA